MKIETKFNIGDLIYSFNAINNEQDCSMCNGTGGLTDDVCIYSCPKCEGLGVIFCGIKFRVIGPYKIKGISIFRGYKYAKFKEPYDEKYYVDNLDNYEYAPNYDSFECNNKQNKMFKTKEEAQIFCKNKNRRKNKNV